MLYYFSISFELKKNAFFDGTKVLFFFVVRNQLKKYFLIPVYFFICTNNIQILSVQIVGKQIFIRLLTFAAWKELSK